MIQSCLDAIDFRMIRLDIVDRDDERSKLEIFRLFLTIGVKRPSLISILAFSLEMVGFSLSVVPGIGRVLGLDSEIFSFFLTSGVKRPYLNSFSANSLEIVGFRVSIVWVS